MTALAALEGMVGRDTVKCDGTHAGSFSNQAFDVRIELRATFRASALPYGARKPAILS
jgi:hypothetical protein